jgi:hypothetical protein
MPALPVPQGSASALLKDGGHGTLIKCDRVCAERSKPRPYKGKKLEGSLVAGYGFGGFFGGVSVAV